MKNTMNYSPTLQSIIAIRDQKRALYDLPGELTPANNFSSAAKMFDLYLATRPGGKEAAIDDIDIAVFMTIVKLCRIAVAKEHIDNYPDGANYLILAGDRAIERVQRRERQGDMLDAVSLTMQANKGAATSGLRRGDDPLSAFKIPPRAPNAGDKIFVGIDPAVTDPRTPEQCRHDHAETIRQRDEKTKEENMNRATGKDVA